MKELEEGSRVRVIGGVDRAWTVAEIVCAMSGIPLTSKKPVIGATGTLIIKHHVGGVNRVELDDYPSETTRNNTWPFRDEYLEPIE